MAIDDQFRGKTLHTAQPLDEKVGESARRWQELAKQVDWRYMGKAFLIGTAAISLFLFMTVLAVHLALQVHF